MIRRIPGRALLVLGLIPVAAIAATAIDAPAAARSGSTTPVAVNPGDHTVRLKGATVTGKKVTVREKETAQVAF